MEIRNRIKRLVTVPASSIAPSPHNWRTHPKNQASALRGLLADLGFAGAVLVREPAPEQYEAIDGHLRLETMGKRLVPVLVTDLSEDEAKKLIATFDPLGAMATADAGKLKELLAGITTDNDAVRGLLAQVAAANGLGGPVAGGGGDEFDTTPAKGKTRTKVGQVWRIGDGHRLAVGDCTDAGVVERLMGGEKAGLMNTDPPYGVDFLGAKYNPRAKQWDGIANDTLQGNHLEDFLRRMFAAWLPVMDEVSAFYFWTAAMAEGAAAAAAIRAAGLHIQSQIIWNKNTLVLGQADYHWKHENCWYAFWKGKKHRWFGKRDKTTVWDVPKLANSAYEHPMQKPLELYSIPMRHHTIEGERVVDPFAGSGSQFIAAHRLGRICYGCEIEPHYADVILKRCEAEGLTTSLEPASVPSPSRATQAKKARGAATSPRRKTKA